MRNIFFYISFVLILITSIISCFNENLPFLEGKYLFWLGVLCLILFILALKNECKTFKINSFDAIFLALAVSGGLHFLLFSKSTIYNSDIWYYIGYLTLYLLLRNQCSTVEITKKTLSILLYFCTASAVINVFLMFLQWKQWISSPNEFFAITGMFFSPNQLGIYLSIGLLCTLFLAQKSAVLWLQITFGLITILLFLGLCYTESRGAFISLFTALGFYLFSSKLNWKSLNNWKTYLSVGLLLIGGFYFLYMVTKSKAESTSGRLFTTKQVLKQIVEQPYGYGLNSFALEYNKAKAKYFESNSNWEEMKNAGYIYKANNDLLELTFELGVPWIALFLLFIVLLFLKKSDSTATQIGRTLLLCLFVFSLTTSIITKPIFLIIACICAVMIMNSTNPKVIYEFKNRGIFRLIGMGLSLSFAYILITRINAENQLFKLFEDKMYLKGENQLQCYVSKIDNNGEEIFMGGLTLVKNGYMDEGFHYLEIGFEHSGRPSLGRVLANGLKQQKKYAQAEEIYTYNKNVEPYRYEARVDLLNLFIETKQDKKAKAIAQEIIQLPVKIPSLKIELYNKKAKKYLSENVVKQKNHSN